MHVRDALDRLEAIHAQLARTEVYRGFRVPAVAAVGVLAFLAAVVQPLIPGAAAGAGFVWFWVAVAGACGLLGSAAAVHAYLYREDEFARHRTRRVAAQFAPCVLAGGALTLGFARVPDLIGFLPGLWAAVFGLGMVAARPHLPAGIGAVGLAYVAAGAFHFLRTLPGAEPDSWSVGTVFGAGHLLTAFVLWRDHGEDDDE